MTQSARVRQTLVVCQVALTVVLLCGAGLLVRTVVALNGADSGFDKRDVLTMEIRLPGARYNAERTQGVLSRGGGRASGAARRRVGGGGQQPGGDRQSSGRQLVPPPRHAGAAGRASGRSTTIRVVTPGYFRTLGIPVLRGREFTPADDISATPGFLVNEAFVTTFLSERRSTQCLDHGVDAERESLPAHRRRGRQRERGLGQGRARSRRCSTAIARCRRRG